MVEENTNQEGGEVMATSVVDIKSLIYKEDYINLAINTKEEASVLESLFQGAHLFEDRKALRDLKLSKIVDMF